MKLKEWYDKLDDTQKIAVFTKKKLSEKSIEFIKNIKSSSTPY